MCENKDCNCDSCGGCNMNVDANGRFVDPQAYTAEIIGKSICSILSDQQLPIGLVKDIVKLQLDIEPSDGCNSDELRVELIAFGNELDATFVEGHATDEEIHEGFLFALGVINAFEKGESDA